MVSRLPKSKGRQSRSELADIAGFRLQAETVPERPPLPDLPFFRVWRTHGFRLVCRMTTLF